MKKAIHKAIPHLILVSIVGIICAGLEGYLSIHMMRAVDWVIEGNKELFKEEVLNLVFFAFALFPISIFLSFTKGFFKRKAIVSAKASYLEGIFNKNINEFQRDNNSSYVSALTNDVNTIENNYINGILEVTLGLISFLVSTIVIASVSPIALGIGVAIGVVSTLISVLMSKPLQNHQTQRSELYEGYTSYIKEVLSAFHIIKSNNLVNKVQKDYNNKSTVIQQKGYIIVIKCH